jgi:prolyl-tRNA synthetase
VPVVKGKKSDDERFAGAYFTTTTEIYVPVSGRGIQGATSHQLGQNFAKMFEINFEDQNSEKKQVWQTSWGLSTRSIGAMIMVHSDDTGLVLPPKVAHTQVVIIPIIKKGDDAAAIKAAAEKAYSSLKAAGVRVDLDDRDNYNPGFKYNHWELRGTPIRLELGKKDFDNQEVRCCKRHDGVKSQIKQDTLAEEIPKLLEVIHKEMYDKALKARLDHVKDVDNWKDFMDALGGRNLCMAPWCDVQACEVEVKDRSKEESLALMLEKNEEEAMLTGSAKTLCIPFEQKPLAEGTKCFACGKDAKVTALWGRSY